MTKSTLFNQASHFIGANQLYNAYHAYQDKNYHQANTLFKDGIFRFSIFCLTLSGGYYYRESLMDSARSAYNVGASFFSAKTRDQLPPARPAPLPLKPEPPPEAEKTYREVVVENLAWGAKKVWDCACSFFTFIYDVSNSVYGFLRRGGYWVYSNFGPKNHSTFCIGALRGDKDLDALNDCQETLSSYPYDVQVKIEEQTSLEQWLKPRHSAFLIALKCQNDFIEFNGNEGVSSNNIVEQFSNLSFPEEPSNKDKAFSDCVLKILRNETALRGYLGLS